MAAPGVYQHSPGVAPPAAPATKYFTYAPGKAPAGAAGQQIKLGPGQTIGFAVGKGYYAKTAGGGNPYAPPARPTVPPPVDPMAALTPDQIDKNATDLANAALSPQQAEIRRQQALATANANADKSAITGFSTAAADILKGMAPDAAAAYEKAAQTEGQLGQGLATGVANDVAAHSAADQAFMESQGQSGTPGPDSVALHDAIYNLNGRIPGDTLAEQGAAAAAWGLAQPPIALNAGREQLDQRMATARQENDQYAQQLIQLAAQFPAEKAKALQQLNQYEIDKANYRLNQWQTHQQIAIQRRSELAQEKAAGLTADYHTAEMKYKWASLQFQTEKAMQAAKNAAAKGKTIDVGASKLLGHIVYKDGTQDASIKVAKSSSGSGGVTQAAKVRARMTANTNAFKEATTLLGKPIAAPKGSGGAYIARKNGVPKSALIPPAYPGGPTTTNNPKYANRAGGASDWADAFGKVWAATDGDTLIASYGYTKEQVTSWVTNALRRAGWKRK